MPTAFEINPTLCFTLLGTFIIYLWTLPPRAARLAVLLLAVGLRAACIRWMGGLGGYYGVWWISWGAFLGIASLIVLSMQIVRSRPTDRRSLFRTFYAGAVFPLCSLLIGYTIPITTWLRPKTWDAFLLAFDGGLGFQLNFGLGRLLLHSPTLLGLTTVVYYALPLAACVLYASYRLRERQPVAILALFLSLMVVGYVQYGLFPAVGPVYAFPQWYPLHPPAFAQIAILPMTVPNAARNCMPSLHLAAALVVCGIRASGRDGEGCWCFSPASGTRELHRLSTGSLEDERERKRDHQVRQVVFAQRQRGKNGGQQKEPALAGSRTHRRVDGCLALLPRRLPDFAGHFVGTDSAHRGGMHWCWRGI